MGNANANLFSISRFERALRCGAGGASAVFAAAKLPPSPYGGPYDGNEENCSDDPVLPVHRSEDVCDVVDDPGDDPGDGRVVEDRGDGPFPAGFGADGDDRGDAGDVEQDEDEQSERRGRREVAAGEQPRLAA